MTSSHSPTRLSISRLFRALVFLAFLLEGFLALIFILDASVPGTTILIAALVGTILFAAIVWLSLRANPRAASAETTTSGKNQLAVVILVGLIVRVCWLVLVPPVQVSDYQRYLNAARNLLANRVYVEDIQGHIFHAFTPPGLPMVLAGGLWIFGDHAWTPGILNLIFFVLSSFLIAAIANRIFGRRAAILSVCLFAIWPSYVALTGMAASEPLFVFLLLGACFFLFLAPGAALQWSPICGVAAGLATLTRPTALTLPVLWIAAILLLGLKREWIKSVAIATVFLAVTIAPWTIRNYRVFGTFVAVSTNGGDVFYRSNNPLATGSWTARGERDLSAYMENEVSWNKTGFAWGKDWVRTHPMEFLKLAIRKEFIFLGSDETGVYWAIERTHPEWSVADRVGKAVSDLWWLGIWGLLLVALILHRREGLEIPQTLCLLLPFLYFAGIHSIFESQERYHIPAVPFLLIAAALAFTRNRLRSGQETPKGTISGESSRAEQTSAA